MAPRNFGITLQNNGQAVPVVAAVLVDQSAGDAGPAEVVPKMVSGGHVSVQTAAAGANFAAFTAQACKQLTIFNNTGTTIEVHQGGAGVAVPIFDQGFFTFYGLTNANQLGIRRVDQSNTQVTAQARWEA